jgi:hypothetical protein
VQPDSCTLSSARAIAISSDAVLVGLLIGPPSAWRLAN